jgi:hypothetical protein
VWALPDSEDQGRSTARGRPPRFTGQAEGNGFRRTG